MAKVQECKLKISTFGHVDVDVDVDIGYDWIGQILF